MLKKTIILGFIITLLIAAAGYYFVFVYSVKHHRNVNDEKAISVSAGALADAFSKDEKLANAQYLNKAIDVKGAVVSINYDQIGQKTVLLGAEMEMYNVFITLKDSSKSFKIGDTIQVKAICNGFLSDVVLTDGVVQR
jgi:hypothetical protein